MGTFFLYLVVSVLSSVTGTVCGIGGGVIVKPVLDFFAMDSVAAVSFLSGCTVLVMSLYNVGKNRYEKDKSVDFKFCTPIAIGAAAGGIAGKIIFSALIVLAGNERLVGQFQSICMSIIALGTIFYILLKSRIKTLHCRGLGTRFAVGIGLGVLSSFLGIGGGPIQLVVFYFLFSMETKAAAQNSLYTIFVSQLASLITSIFTRTVPNFDVLALAVMVIGGISGGVIGRMFLKKMNNKSVEMVFLCVMFVIIGISCYNITK